MVCMLYLHDKHKSLRQYCIEQKYNYQKIREYVVEDGLSLDAALQLYETRKGRRNCKTKYFYKGKPLKDFCIEHNYCYAAVLTKVLYKNLTVDEAVESYSNHKERMKMPKEKRKVNYLLYGSNLIPNNVINTKDFVYIDDIKKVEPEDYPRIFTLTDGGMYASYKEGFLYYFLLKKELFTRFLKELSK